MDLLKTSALRKRFFFLRKRRGGLTECACGNRGAD
jgi:hypothetical protein